MLNNIFKIKNKSKNYGLKVSSNFNIKDFKKVILRPQADESKLIISEPGVYNIYIRSNIIIEHSIIPSLIHITCHTQADNLNISLLAKGLVSTDESADVYHSIINKNQNVKVNIGVKGVATDNAKIIYRSSLAATNSSSGIGGENAKFLTLGAKSFVASEPALDIESNNYPTTHSLSISNVSSADLWYLAIRGYNVEQGKSLLVNGFLEKDK